MRSAREGHQRFVPTFSCGLFLLLLCLIVLIRTRLVSGILLSSRFYRVSSLVVLLAPHARSHHLFHRESRFVVSAFSRVFCSLRGISTSCLTKLPISRGCKRRRKKIGQRLTCYCFRICSDATIFVGQFLSSSADSHIDYVIFYITVSARERYLNFCVSRFCFFFFFFSMFEKFRQPKIDQVILNSKVIYHLAIFDL